VLKTLRAEFNRPQVRALMQDLRSGDHLKIITAGEKLMHNPGCCPPDYVKALLTSPPKQRLIAVRLLQSLTEREAGTGSHSPD
jgi:hypothetical protein